MLAKQQHYVPRFILKNFAHGKKQQVWAFDKHTDKSFRTSIDNIAAEKGFYNLENENGITSLEPALGRVEEKAATILGELIKVRSLQSLSEDTRTTLALFFAVQFVRTKEHRLMIDSFNTALKGWLQGRGAPDEDLQSVLGGRDGDASKKTSLAFLLRAPELIPHFLQKTWMLLEAPSFAPLYISDNPLSLDNRLDHGFYGNLGLRVVGIEIYFPISTRLSISMVCPSIGLQILNAHAMIQSLDNVDQGLSDVLLKTPSMTREFCSGVVNGKSLHLEKENVTRLNSLQVRFSSRYVYCENDDFDLVRQMIQDNPKFREGLKPTYT